MTKCQTLKKFWHLELFYGIYYVISNSVIFLGRTSKKTTLYNISVYPFQWRGNYHQHIQSTCPCLTRGISVRAPHFGNQCQACNDSLDWRWISHVSISLKSALCVFLNILQPVEASLSLDRTIQECAADVVDALRNLPRTKLS